MQDEARVHGGIVLSSRPYTERDYAEELSSYLKQGDVDAVIVAGGQFSINPPATPARTTPIPIILCTASLQGIPITCDLQPDLRRAAELVVTYLAEQLHGQGRIVHLQGPPDNGSAVLRAQGFAAALAQHPQLTAIEAYGAWDRALGAKAMHDVLATHPAPQAVFAHSDQMALGAIEALEQAGRSDVLVGGVDAIPEALMAIHAGRMVASADMAPYKLGQTALRLALQALRHEVLPPTLPADVRLITAESLVDAMLDTVQVLPGVLRSMTDAYRAQLEIQTEMITTQQQVIRELSTPLIPISDTVMVMPLIGAISTSRAAQITEAALEAISRQGTQVLIIDITGVAVVDTSVINHLLQMAQASQLLGTIVVMVGISPEVAQTIVQLGLDLSRIVTRSTLQAGLEYATRKVQH
jgi:ABC-type sugar transport system substrate-binding protein/anti-anti-sigma regulatory factor